MTTEGVGGVIVLPGNYLTETSCSCTKSSEVLYSKEARQQQGPDKLWVSWVWCFEVVGFFSVENTPLP